MIYPNSVEEKINFDKIKELIKAECSSSLGVNFVDKLNFSKDLRLITRLLDQTEEFRQILVSGESFPASNFTNIYPYLEKAKIEGTFLYEDDFHEIKLSLMTLSGCVAFFKKFAEEYPNLHELLGLVSLDQTLLKAIEKVIDEKGKIRNNASKDLSLIRSQIIYEESRLRKVLDRIFREAKAKGLTPDDASVTIRGGRMVIPVLAENKRKIKGFIHDESATGQTVFLEPAEVLDINNELKDLEYMERREIQKILTQLTDLLRGYIPELRKAYQFLGLVDFIRAKAKFAIKTNASRPILEKQKQIEWYNATHPLLQFALKQQGKSVVPLNIHLDHNRRLLVISGPNAGGKSVTLKTVAMIQYMLQCGLLVPIDSHSKCSIFDHFFIDIGDEQNIENDLSTYSSHLMSMKYFTQFADKKTILFIDEFGTGTEPQFGAAIAEGILLSLNKLGAYGVITTHYGNLKEIASKNQGLVNGAMRYDVDKLEPLYQLEIGKPGSSFALEIASKIGISKEIIDYAKENIGEDRVRYDKMLNKLENEKVRYEQLINENAKKERQLDIRIREYNSLKETIDKGKKQYIEEAKKEAKLLLDDVNKKIETTIRAIKENKADKEATKTLRADLETFKAKIKPEKVVEKAPEIKVIEGEIEVGDFVRLKDNGAVAEVLAIKNKDVEISMGDLKSNVKMKRLERISSTEMKKEKKSFARRTGFDANAKMMDFSSNLDIRGKRGEEILPLVQNFIDDGYMLGMKDLRIVHGKGDGILKEITRNILKNMHQVAKVKDEHADRGGSGVSIVELKG
ncbi:mismatch repair ATPase (MutS family) [Belliella baltica DSM 15883]|uniref:Endonuclease MutS2 n=1 Tax=Belliella baltica (strain DSM 15883 / CIP 108006 / LMG 21964 / BA134) TaxID=866536 RepID=I3ZAE2_BELBD|nr:Smr/MutS family protein [Belliella baltica]AFL86210.1 mismatch repair ATPase (MutS family) [Belliella baltica DSM 15883]